MFQFLSDAWNIRKIANELNRSHLIQCTVDYDWYGSRGTPYVSARCDRGLYILPFGGEIETRVNHKILKLSDASYNAKVHANQVTTELSKPTAN